MLFTFCNEVNVVGKVTFSINVHPLNKADIVVSAARDVGKTTDLNPLQPENNDAIVVREFIDVNVTDFSNVQLDKPFCNEVHTFITPSKVTDCKESIPVKKFASEVINGVLNLASMICQLKTALPVIVFEPNEMILFAAFDGNIFILKVEKPSALATPAPVVNLYSSWVL